MFFMLLKNSIKKGLDVRMVIFGFCQHLGPFLKKNVGMTTLPTCRVMSSLSYIPFVYDDIYRLGDLVIHRGCFMSSLQG